MFFSTRAEIYFTMVRYDARITMRMVFQKDTEKTE